MKPFDGVKLIKPFNGMKVGTKGAILDPYPGGYFEVEFFDDEGNTIEVCPIHEDYLEVTWVMPEKKEQKE